MQNKKIVCLGGGIGTVNLLRGLKKYTKNITTVISMADDGGSAGRLRRLYNVMPPGDLVSCMAAMTEDPLIQNLLKYRFTGERYGKDTELGGHKLGNLILVALRDLSNGSYEDAIKLFKKTFNVEGNFLPATRDHVEISAKTIDGQEIFGEEKIDLGKYRGKRILEKVFLHPQDAPAAEGVIKSILDSEAVILGPGDLYTNLLPVLIVPEITKALSVTKAKKIFIINVANKPFETRDYKVEDFIDAIKRHIGIFPFNTVLINNNFSISIPKKYHYDYVKKGNKPLPEDLNIIAEDLVDNDFPLYHNPDKLAKVVLEHI